MARLMFNPDKERYYYVRDKKDVPRVTVCLLKVGNLIGKGISLCSFDEKKINKMRGRGIAKKRAIEALRRGNDSLPIQRDEAMDVLNSISLGFLQNSKSIFDPILDNYESKIINV